jgi:thiamine pyrophosphokinase
VIEHPSRKDATDSELAYDLAVGRGCDKIIFYGGVGGRFDHSYANVKLLERGDVMIHTGTETLYVLRPGEHQINNQHTYLSIFALKKVRHLYLKGFSYELEDVTLRPDDLRGISNQGSGTIEFASGALLVIHQTERT